MLSLSGINYHCYRAGQSFGIWHALQDAATNINAVNHKHSPQLIALANDLLLALPPGGPLAARVKGLIPAISRDLEEVAKQFNVKAVEHKAGADVSVGELQRQGVGLPWWKSWWVLAGGLGLLGMVVSTAISTALVFYLLR